MTTPEDPYSPPAPPAYGYGYGPQVGQVPPAGWGPPPQYGRAPTAPAGQYGPPQTEVKALIALGLAIAAYTPTIPFIGAIAALVLARMARRDILDSGGRLTGLSLCTWAVVLAWIHLVLIGLFLLFVLGLFLLPFGFL